MLPILRRPARDIWENPLDLFDRSVSRSLGRMFEGDGNTGDWASYPVDIHEDENNILVEAEMPGFKKEEVSVSLENGILMISAERKAESKQGKEHLCERRYLKIARSFSLPGVVDESKIDAKLEGGVLKLRLPKTAASKATNIPIK
jgi:HSP20 family protein